MANLMHVTLPQLYLDSPPKYDALFMTMCPDDKTYWIGFISTLGGGLNSMNEAIVWPDKCNLTSAP